MGNKCLYISIGIFLLSLIFLLSQGIVNFEFYKYNIVERTLYEQFSYEVYQSINKKLTPSISIKPECEKGEEKLEFILNLDSFFDCRGIYSDELDKKCKNTIINNYTDCTPSSERIINNNENWDIQLDFDPRNKHCQYYSNYTQTISKLFNNRICKSTGTQYDYEFLLSQSIPKSYSGPNECNPNSKKCGILDTKDNILCLPEDYECPINMIEVANVYREDNLRLQIDDYNYIYFKNNNDSDIINSIIISENKPLNHVWETMIRETYEDISQEEKDKRKIINGKDFKSFDSMHDNTYQELNVEGNPLNLYVSHIKADNPIEGFNRNIYNLKQNLNVYTRKYIGFKNTDELNKFKKKFNDIDPKHNPLYKLSSKKHKPEITISFSVIFICITIAYLVIKIKNIFQEEDKISKIFFYVFFAVIILFLIAELIIIGRHYKNYPIIHIDMDDRMGKVLNRYNNRKNKCQYLRKISAILDFISIVFMSIACYKINKNEEHQPLQ